MDSHEGLVTLEIIKEVWSHHKHLAGAYVISWGLDPLGSDGKKGTGIIAHQLAGNSMKVSELKSEVNLLVLMLL